MEKPYIVASDGAASDKQYKEWISSIKKRLQSSQVKAALSVNSALLEFYWSLGRDIIAMDAENLYGSGFYSRLSLDIKQAFPGVSGFSVTNLKYIKRWVEFYLPMVNSGDREKRGNRQQPVDDLKMPGEFGLLPWGHHICIFTKSGSIAESLFYIHKTIESGWSRRVLEDNISARLYDRQGKAVTNFNDHLPAVQGNLAKEILKDSYNFDFLTLKAGYDEHELETQLVEHISRFLLELGKGFAFVGRQMELVMPQGQVFRPDLVFYHVRLKCYIVIDLKVVPFVPEFAGKMNFYVNAADNLLKGQDDNPSIGLLICKSKDDMVVKWSFQNISAPMGVAAYELRNLLPSEEDVKKALED